MLRKIYRKIKKYIHLVTNRLKKKVPVYVPILDGELLSGRTALITGGTSGIGYSIAESFARNGASVIITGRSQERVDNSVSLLSGKYPSVLIYGIVMDNSNVQSLESGWNQIVKKVGERKVDILVNNAGVAGNGSFGIIEESEYDYILDTNIKGSYFLSQIISQYMVKNQIKGNILNLVSSSGIRPAISPYMISKWGLRGFTAGLAKSLAPYEIVVNGIAPGPTATPMLKKDDDDLSHIKSPIGRFTTAEEIANLSVILTSSLGRMIVGDIIYATGGCGTLTFDDIDYGFL